MLWTNKEKISHMENMGEILTPDGYQILVGPSQDLILVWQEGSNIWNLKTKQNTSWNDKTKTNISWNLKTKIS